MVFLKVFCSILLCNSVRAIFFSPTVEIEQGKLRGVRGGAGINQYFGIPYAISERFQPPREPRRWEGMFNAMNSISACAQARGALILTNEDCLELDVYTPQNSKPGDKLPVFVFFHGGSFFSGTKTLYNPEFLVTKNIVAVTVNYRLGVLGFLCLNGVANLGLKDQAAALRWVRKNIAAFGGDPDHVTIAGQSAGSAATSMHLLSEHSAGLFHKAILMSGNALAPWTFNVDPLRAALVDANKIAKAETEEDVYKIFASSPIRELLTTTRDVSTNLRSFKYAPCVDSNTNDPFFRDTPYEIIKSGNFNKVPVLVGTTDQEGITFYGSSNRSTFVELNTNFTEQLPAVFACSEEDREVIADKVRAYYFGRQPINEKAVRRVVRYASEWAVHATYDAFSQLLAEHSGEPVYKYAFSYDGDRNFIKIFSGGAASVLKGAAHGDDLFYLFKPAGLPIPSTKRDKLFIERYTSILANFIKYSNPTPHPTSLIPEWPPSTSYESYIMHFDRALKVTRGPYHRDTFFLDLLCSYGLHGHVPCRSQELCHPDVYDIVSPGPEEQNWCYWFLNSQQ
ncbi:esterase E4-like [Amyelois transitella]|uniref:esterase E4-like n=1 Tax=Amyelois transitella TaxID=680683 RepID=UPI00298F77F0|nr:esterase E4-like [Amyelois transitella]